MRKRLLNRVLMFVALGALLAACEHLDERKSIGGDTNDLKESDCACQLIYDADGMDQWTS